jgi:hypothetical protein
VALEQALVQQALGDRTLGHDEVLLTRERHRHSLAVALRDVQAADAPDSVLGDTLTGPALVVNARLAPTVPNLHKLEALPK